MYTGSLLNAVLETMNAWQWARVNQCGEKKEHCIMIRESKINYIRVIHIETMQEHEV